METEVYQHTDGPWTVVQVEGGDIHALLRRMADEIPTDARYAHVGRIHQPEGGRPMSFVARYLPAQARKASATL